MQRYAHKNRLEFRTNAIKYIDMYICAVHAYVYIHMYIYIYIPIMNEYLHKYKHTNEYVLLLIGLCKYDSDMSDLGI